MFIEECDTDFIHFCETSTFKNGEITDYTCGYDEFCTSKSCYDSVHCTKPWTFEHDYPGLNNVKFTITCCDTDLCNVQSSAKNLYEISFSSLFYMCVLVIFY